MEEKIKKIIKKVREMYKYNDRVNHLLEMHPSVELEEIEEGKLKLKSISFSYYDSLCVTNQKISYRPEMKGAEVLLEYNSFDELLKL